MKSQNVMLDYAKSACILRKGKRRITVSQKALARDEISNKETSNEKSPKLLSALQVKRRLRKGNRVMLAVVSEVKPDQPVADQVEDWLKGLQTEFSDVFVDPLPPGLPPERNYGHSIPTEPGHVPPFRPMYRLSPIEMRETKEQITTLLANGLIEPSKSPYGAPILFVPKPNGRGLRLCIDFRALNAITIKNRYPIPRIDDLLDAIQGAKYFTNFDLTSGYHQIRISDEDVPKTAFRTPFGHYQFKVLIEGLTNAPATFQTVMNDIFKPYIRDFVVVYLDDIMVYSKTLKDHKKHVRLVLEVLRKERFYACLAKCEFAKPEIKFLGHIVGADGIKVNAAKIAAVEEWPAPTDVHKVRSFLGLANYFRKFIQGYAKLAAPLTDLTKATRPWNWTEECQKSFDGIKWSLTHAPVLRSPVGSVPYEVVSDTSGIGLGAVLLQEDQPVAFESRKLSPAEQNYTTTEQELLGVIHALRVWRCYLEGVRFTVITDHCPNTFFQTQPNLSRRQARCQSFFRDLTFSGFIALADINVADPLSRNPVGSALAVITRSWRNKEVIRAGQPEVTAPSTVPARGGLPTFDIADPLLSQLLQAYPLDSWLRDANSQESTRLSTNSQGLYLRDSRVYVPNDTVIKNSIMFEAHDAKYSGHFGVAKTLKLVERLFWWPNFRKEILHYVNHCPLCQYNKSVQLKPAGLLQPLPIPERPWDSVSFDFIVQLPKTLKGHDAIVVFVDRLTKMVHFQPTTSDVSAEGFAFLWYDHVFRHHGTSKEFVSDRDARFTSKFWAEACKLLGTKLATSTAFHPQTDGQTERANRTLEVYLRHYVSTSHDDWDDLLAAAEFAYNNAWQESVKATPFQLNSGQQARTPLGLGNASVPAAGTFVGRIQESISRAKTLLHAAQQRMKVFADQKRREIEYKVGDQMLLSTKYLKLKTPGARKLLPRWIGPFKVLERIGAVAYKLDITIELKSSPGIPCLSFASVSVRWPSATPTAPY